MALTTIKRILRSHDVTVVGSAPLSLRELDLINRSDRLICVNGSISSVQRTPDVWVLNSREYDSPLYLDPKRWPEERQKLHDAMMAQSIGRSARHVLFLLKNNFPDQTIARLKAQGTRWWGQTVLGPGPRTDLGRKAGIRKFGISFNTSAGVFALCLALTSGAKHVNVVGFSLENNAYAYLPAVPPDTRKHIAQDIEALEDLQVHKNRFTLLTAA